MSENNLDFLNPLEPLGDAGNANMASTSPISSLPFEGDTLKDPEINFPVHVDRYPLNYLNTQENLVGTPSTKSNLERGTVSLKDALKSMGDQWARSSQAQGEKTAKAQYYAYDNTPDSNAFYKRYAAYGQETFDKVGFSPLRNNEEIFNAHTSMGDDFSRMMTHSFWPLFSQGFIAGPKSMIRGIQGDFGTDLEDARIYAEAAAIGQSSRGGAGAFMSNAFMNFAYTAGIITESIVEMGVAAILAAPTAGGSVVLTAANLGRKGLQLGRLGKVAPGVERAASQALSANQFRQSLSNLKNIENARAVSKWAKAENALKGLDTAAGRFLNPFAELTEGIATGLKNSRNLTGWAKTATIGKATAGGLYRNAHTLNAALAEARLEGGIAENTVFDQLYRKHRIDNNGEEPDEATVKDMRDEAKDAGLTALVANVAIIYASNKIVLDNIYGGKGPLRNLMNRKAKEIMDLKTGKLIRTVQKQTLKSGKVIKKAVIEYSKKGLKSGFKNFARQPITKTAFGAVNYFKRNVMEGIQENTQEAIASATEGYYMATFENPELANSQFAWAQIKHGINEQFTAQGAETFASGFVMGAFAGPLNSIPQFASVMGNRFKDPKAYAEYKEKRDNYGNKLAETLNSINLKDFYDNPVWNYGSQMEFNKAIRSAKTESERDALFQEQVKSESFIHAINHAMEHNTMDLYYDQINSVKDMTQEEFEEAYNLEPGAGKAYLENSSKMMERAKSVEARWKEAKDLFPEPADLQEMLTISDKNSVEFEQASLLVSAWREARKSYVFFHESFEATKQHMLDLTNDVMTIMETMDISPSDIRVLFDQEILLNETALLQREIDMLESMEGLTKEQKKELKDKKVKHETMNNLYESADKVRRIDKAGARETLRTELTVEYPEASEVEINEAVNLLYDQYLEQATQIETEIEINFKAYIRALHKDQDYEFKNSKVDDAYHKYLAFLKLDTEQKDMAKVINIVSDEQGYLDMVEKNMIWMKELYAKRGEYYKKIVEKGFQDMENNDILNELANQGVYISEEALAEWVNNETIPEEFFINDESVIIKRGHHRYDNYVLNFIRALNVRKPVNVTDKAYQDKVDALIKQRDAAIEALPKTTQRVDKQIIVFPKDVKQQLSKFKDKIQNGQYVELTYQDGKETKTLILFKDDKGNFRYENVEGNIFDQSLLQFTAGQAFIMVDKPEAAEVQRINKEYAEKIAQVKAEHLAAQAKKGEPFVNITKETPYSAMPNDLKQELQDAYIQYSKDMGKPVIEGADVSEDDMLNFILTNKQASAVINAYNARRNAEENQASNFDVEFVDKEGNTRKASEYTEDQLRKTIQRLKLEISELQKIKDPTTEQQTKLNEYQATLIGLEGYINHLATTGYTDVQRAIQRKYKEGILDNQNKIKTPEETGNGTYEIEGGPRTRISNLIKQLETRPYQDHNLIDLDNLYNKLLKDQALTPELLTKFYTEFLKANFLGYQVTSNQQGLLKDLNSLEEGSFVSLDIIKELFNKHSSEDRRAAGTYIHKGIENLLNGLTVEFNEKLITQEAYEQLFGSTGVITELMKEFKAKGLLVLGMENIVFDSTYAGTMDLTVVDRAGNVSIIDVKTGDAAKWKSYANIENSGNLVEDISSARETNILQLTAYRNLLYNLTGIKASINILPIEIGRDTKTGVITSARFPSQVPGLTKEGSKLIRLKSNILSEDKATGERMTISNLINKYIPAVAPVTETSEASTPGIRVATDINPELRAKLNKAGVDDALIAVMTKEELTEFNSYKDVDERNNYINSLREKHSKDLKDHVTFDLIDKIIEKSEERGNLLVEMQAAQDLLNALENMLDSNVGATTETIQRLLDKIESIEKDFNTRFDSKTKLKSRQVETLAKTKERVQKSLRGELSDLNILADTVRDIKDNLSELRSIDQDLSKQIKYYESLIVRYGDRINEDAVYDLIDKAEKKAGFVKKMITALLNLLAKARKLLAGHIGSFQKANTAYETALKDSNFKDVSESQLRSMLNSSDPLQRNKADAYFDMRRHIEALENAVVETMDTADNAEQQLSEQESRLQDNVKAYEKYLNQIRYLEELLTDNIGKADDITLSQPLPVTPKGPAPIVTTQTKTFGKKANNAPFSTRNGANSQLDRVAKENNIPVESLIVVQAADGKGFVIVDSGKRPTVPKPQVGATVTQPAAVVDTETKKAEIEKRRQGLISKYNVEFKEIARKQYDKVSKKYIDGISTQIWSNGKLIAEYETKIEAENELNKKLDALINNIIDSKISLGDNIFIDGITIDGSTFSVLNTSERMITIVDIGGVKVPFYLTTGLGGKNLTPAWYPMFGYSPSGWLNKTDGKDMESFYSRIIGKEASDVLKKVSEKLNNKLGVTPNSIIESGIISKQQTQEAVNSVLSFTPAENQKIDASVDYKVELTKLENNIKSIGEEINAKYDAELAALEGQTTPLLTEEQSLAESAIITGNAFTITTSKSFTEAKTKLENAKTRKEANDIYRLAIEQLDNNEIEALKIVYKDNESKWATVKADVATPLTLDQLKVGMIIVGKKYGESFKVVSKVDGVYTAQNVMNKDILVPLNEKNIKSFIRKEDMGKNEPAPAKQEFVITEESKANLIQNKDNVAIFIANSSELSKLNELAAKADLKDIEEDLLNNIDC